MRAVAEPAELLASSSDHVKPVRPTYLLVLDVERFSLRDSEIELAAGFPHVNLSLTLIESGGWDCWKLSPSDRKIPLSGQCFASPFS